MDETYLRTKRNTKTEPKVKKMEDTYSSTVLS